MKKHIPLTILITYLLSACGIGARAVNNWNIGVEKYTAAETAIADCNLTVFTEFSSMTITIQLNQSYNQAVVDTQQAWSSAFNDAAAEVAALQAGYQSTATPNEQGHIDLGTLQEQGMMPAQIASQGFTLMINAVQQAQAIAPDHSVTLAAMDTIQEGYNHINFVCKEANNIVRDYNNWVHSAEPAVVVEVAQQLGLDYLPKNLPLYTPPPIPNPATNQ